MMDAEQVLRANGWFPGRRVDASAGERALVAAGYSTWPELTALLLEFSGISIPFKRHGRNDTVWFDAERAVSWADPASVHEYETRVGTQLAPIGYAYHDHMLLLAAEDGRVVGAYDDYVAEVGASPIEAVARVMSQDLQPIGDT